METDNPGLERLKEGMRKNWMSGDFGKVAVYAARGEEEFMWRLGLRPGTRVLDVACGTGNLAIPAAREGALVTGVDIATNLLQQARERAALENLAVKFDEGDAEHLPYPDARFDVVVSVFGAMFAPRPEVTVKELLRVCRPGGLVAMANWTTEGFVGQSFVLTARHVPPPEGITPPLLWGDEDTVRERFAHGTSKISVTRRTIEMRYPFSAKGTVEFMRQYFGPTAAAYAKLDEAGQAALAADSEKLFTECNRGPTGETWVTSEYLEIHATRADLSNDKKATP
jgi:ubiquinone/menaquinone biosynthesis C-methylase UbiE